MALAAAAAAAAEERKIAEPVDFSIFNNMLL